MDGEKVLMSDLREDIRIIYQSEKDAVVYKPAGIATQLSDDVKGSSLESNLKTLLGKENIFFPHRLDRVTSGLLLVCFDRETAAYYSGQIRDRKFKKHYRCLAESSIPDPEKLTGIHKRFIKTAGGKSSIVNSGGKPSFLEIISVIPENSLPGLYKVYISLITGRTHQIRVMLADLGIPLSGDKLYNPSSKFKDFYLESVVLEFSDTEGVNRYFDSDNKIIRRIK